MATNNMKYMIGLLSGVDPVAVELFEALIAEVERLQNRVEVLERVREFNERAQQMSASQPR